jgi:hypothetical protein
MVRAKLWDEDMQARFPEGTFKQIETVLNEDESRTDFVREAVEPELKRRATIRKLRKRLWPRSTVMMTRTACALCRRVLKRGFSLAQMP